MKKRRALAFIPLLVGVAAAGALSYLGIQRARRDDFAWDPRLHPAAFVGKRWREDVHRAVKRAARNVKSDYRPDRDDEKTEFGYRGVHEVCAVSSVGRATAERVTIEAWRELQPDGTTDGCLEGRTVLLEAGAPPTWTIEGKKLEPTQSAAAFLDQLMRNAVAFDDAPGDFDEVLPKNAPVREGDEWSIDPAPFAETILGGTESFPERSTGHGKLSKVRLEAGAHVGTVDATVHLKLKQVPGEPMGYVEGGVATIHILEDRSLEPAKSEASTAAMELHLPGIAVAKKQEGKIYVHVEISVSEQRKRTPLEPLKR